MLEGYLCNEYGFVSCAATELSNTYMHRCVDPRPMVMPDIVRNAQAEFVRRRGLLIDLRRPQDPALSLSLDPVALFCEIDDTRMSEYELRGFTQSLGAQVE